MGFGFRAKVWLLFALMGLLAIRSAAQTQAPVVPSGVKALGEDGRVVLVWKASSGATSYHLKRSTTSGGPYTTIASPTCLCSTSLGLANGTTYYFVVSAVNSAGESANSAQVSATPTGAAEPAVPSGLKTMAGNGQAVLVWKASSGATSYHLKRSDDERRTLHDDLIPNLSLCHQPWPHEWDDILFRSLGGKLSWGKRQLGPG